MILGKNITVIDYKIDNVWAHHAICKTNLLYDI
nr:MAG TPA: hypothetical protein [Caudoviricetes sp.]